MDEVFDLIGHPTVAISYALSHAVDDSERRNVGAGMFRHCCARVKFLLHPDLRRCAR